MIHEEDSAIVKNEEWKFLKEAQSFTYPANKKDLVKQLKVSSLFLLKLSEG